MTTVRPELGFERLLDALEQDLLEATDEEILATVKELGMNPSVKGSFALWGVTFAARLTSPEMAARLWPRENNSRSSAKKPSGKPSAPRSRRRRKGDTPPSK